MSKFLFFIFFSIYSFILSDLMYIELIKLGKVNIYALDIFHIIIIISIVIAFKKNEFPGREYAEKIFYVLLLYIIFQVIRGFTIYGYQSIGESRFIAPLFMSFIPFAFFKAEKFKETELFIFFETLLYLAGLAGLLMFVVEYIYGGRFFLAPHNIINFEFMADPRGIRYLDVYHVYNMVLLALYIILKIEYSRRFKIKQLLLAGVLIIAALLSQGRTSIIALFASFVFILLIRGKVKIVLYSFLFALVSFVIFFIVAYDSATRFIEMYLDYRSVIEPTQDYTGTGFWRWAVNASAVEQALQTFWIGQSYGGYFYFYVPIVSKYPVEVTPHNMYIVILLKSGVIGLFLLCLFLFVYILKLIKSYWYSIKNGQKEKSFYISIILLVLVSQIPYGMSYTFIQLIGLYVGFGFILLRTESL